MAETSSQSPADRDLGVKEFVRPLPWPLIAATLVAMTALFFTSDHSIVPPLMGVLLVLNRLTDWRVAKNRALSWSIRAGIYTAVIALVGVPTERSAAPWYLNPEYTNIVGGLLCAEIVIRAFELPPAPGGLILLLSMLVMGAAGDTFDRTYIPLLAPIYVLLVVLSLRSFMPQQSHSRSVAPSIQRILAAALVIVIGSTTIRAMVQVDPEIQRWAADFFRRPSRGSAIGLNSSPALGPIFNPDPSMDRILLIDGPQQDRYLRVLAFDNLVSNVWHPSLRHENGRKFSAAPARELATGKPGEHLRFQILGDTFDLLPLPLNTLGIVYDSNLDRDERGTLQFHAPIAGTEFEATVSDSPNAQGPLCVPLDAAMRQRWLQMPDQYNPGIVELARSIVKEDDSPLMRAIRISQNLRANHDYSLEYTPTNDPLGDFILNNRAAHCEYFASALVVMCRAVGVPARFVTGYYAHENAGTDRMVVRDRDAHAWAECWIDGTGWVTLDATPSGGLPDARFAPPSRWRAAWEHVIDFPGTIRDWLSGLTREQVFAFVFVCAGGVIVIQLLQSRRKRPQAADRPYAMADANLAGLARRFEKWLSRQGQSCAKNKTWREHVRGAPHLQTPLRFIEVYEEARFGAANGARVSELEKMIADLETTHSRGKHHG